MKTGFVHTKSLQVDPFVISSINMLKEHSQMTSYKWGGGYLCFIMCKGLSKIDNLVRQRKRVGLRDAIYEWSLIVKSWLKS